MTIRSRVLMTGGLAGGVGGGLVLVAYSALGGAPGATLGLLAAAAAGGAGAWLAADWLARRAGETLAALGEGGERAAPGSRRPIGWGDLDPQFAALREALERADGLREDHEEIERAARDLSASLGEERGSGRGVRRSVLELLEEFRQTAAALVRDCAGLDEATGQIASGAVDQAETVSRTTSTVEALSDRIDRISQNADDAAQACENVRHEARRGLDQVHTVIEGMDRLRSRVDVNRRKASRLGDRSVEIGTIVELISGISSRTDMLALNATIESVRAGEHGRGFAVIAEEIRKLAERTADATREIGTLVEAIQADTHESIQALGEEQTEMEQEAQRVHEAGSALGRISAVAEHSARLVDGISRSANDQVLATQELVRSMQRISEVSHATLEGATRAREGVRLLSQLSERLRRHPASEAAPPRPVHPGEGGKPGASKSGRKSRIALSGTVA